MKKKLLTLATIVMMVGLSANVMAQVTSATENTVAQAEVLGAISITEVAYLEFGGFTPGTNGGTVVMPASGSRSATGDVTLVTGTVSPHAASYTTAGTGLATYSVSIETGFSLTNTTGSEAETMTVGTMTIASGTTSRSFATNGTDAFTVGGTLTVGTAASQTPGVYTGDFDVTVAY